MKVVNRIDRLAANMDSGRTTEAISIESLQLAYDLEKNPTLDGCAKMIVNMFELMFAMDSTMSSSYIQNRIAAELDIRQQKESE